MSTTLKDDLLLLKSMFSDAFDWKAWYGEHGEHGSDEPQDVFGRVYKWHDYRQGNRRQATVSCGGVEFDDTPRALYRALYLLRPAVVDFSDMYKTGTLVDFCSPDKQFMCSVQLHKYETCMRFFCCPEHAVGQPEFVQGGWASCDNGVRCTSDIGNQWFAVAKVALNWTWGVYPGNEFSV